MMLMPDVALDILLPAVLAGSLVIATHVPLGIQVLRRGIIFIDLAIAQVAGLGAYLVTMLLGEAASQVWIQAGAVALALAAAWLLVATERLTVRYQEPVIGIVFVLAATAVILLLAKDPHGGEHLADLLAGQILWISKTQLLYSALATVALLAAMFALRAPAGPPGYEGAEGPDPDPAAGEPGPGYVGGTSPASATPGDCPPGVGAVAQQSCGVVTSVRLAP